ncbi:MAG: GNAT family N-acetyltransferase [Dehalococcoidales bacterium]
MTTLMGLSFVIRIAEERDFEGMMSLLRQLNPDDPVITDGRDKVIFARILKESNLRILILEENGKIISTCYLNIIPNLTRNAAPYAIIENVVTDTAFRNQGFGKKLMAFALDSAWKAGCYKAMLQTGSKKESNHKFYAACGFIEGEKFAFHARNPKFAKKTA